MLELTNVTKHFGGLIPDFPMVLQMLRKLPGHWMPASECGSHHGEAMMYENLNVLNMAKNILLWTMGEPSTVPFFLTIIFDGRFTRLILLTLTESLAVNEKT